MSIITISDFKGEQSIAQTSNAGVIESTQIFIDKYEKKFLKSLLGNALYIDFVNGLLQDPIDQKWIELRDETDLKDMLVNYIYYWYDRNKTTTTNGVSETKGKTENSVVVNNIDKQVRSWNEMVDMARLFDLSTATYPNFVRQHWRNYSYWYFGCRVDEIFYKITRSNI